MMSAIESAPTLQFQQQGDRLTATILEERLRDQQVVNRVREEFMAQVASHPAKQVILDLSKVTFVGSIAFLAFLAMRRAPGVDRIVICNFDPNVKSVFEICKLIPTAQRPEAPFEVADSFQAANAMLGSA